MNNIDFTDDNGSNVTVPESEAEIVSKEGDHTVYAYTNPGGRTLLSVKYNGHGGNGTVGGMDMAGSAPESPSVGNYGGMNSFEDFDEDITTNPPAKPLFTWKNLRLQTAISGMKAAKGVVVRAVGSPIFIGGAAKRFMRRELSSKISIRDAPNMMAIATAEDWFTYMRNLQKSPVDMGAELSASVSPSQQIAVAKFVAEWERDPGQTSIRRKAIPGSDVSELIAKGQMVYDFMQGRGPNPLQAKGYGTFQYDKMFRLAFDIISSLPINTYNSYTLFKMLDDEGANAYREAVDTYVALELGEVTMILEIRDKLATIGPGYANMVINDVGAATEGGVLMQKAVAAYDSGDTSRVRSILNYLQESPFYYGSPGADAKLAQTGSEPTNIFGLRLDSKKAEAQGLKEFLRNGLIYISGNSLTSDNTDGNGNWAKDESGGGGGGKGKSKFVAGGLSFTVHRSLFDTTPVGMIKFQDGKDKFSFIPGIGPTKATNQDRKDRATDLAEAINATPNPSPKGRGNFFYIQMHPKTQLNLKLKPTNQSGRGDMRSGSKPKKGQNYWMKGLYNVLEDMIKENNRRQPDKKIPPMGPAVQAAILKSTGEEAPFQIRLPKHFFKKVNLGGVTTIMPKKDLANKKFIAAYQKFLDYYGSPKHSPSKDIHFRFIIDKNNRGTYYDDVRRKVGDKKRSR